MRRGHFAAFASQCPVCMLDRSLARPLVLATVCKERGDDVLGGMLHCPDPACQHEYPMIDGIPIIMPRLRQHLAERGVELLLRDDLDPLLWGALGDALGPDSWLDSIRQTVSTYAWDSYADLDPKELPGSVTPGAARSCLARLLELAGPRRGLRRMLDLGCGAGRTSFELAAYAPNGLVLGVDSNLALLRLARRVATDGEVRYGRRRIGIVYDERSFAADLPGRDRVDFWACDALALPFAPGTADLAVALNLLDCVPQPQRLLAGMAEALQVGGAMLLATPFDWATRATPLETWVGGHSQRGADGGAGEAFLQTLLTEDAHPQSIAGLATLGIADWPWQTRLHDRAAVTYRSHLVALARTASNAGSSSNIRIEYGTRHHLPVAR